jgi:ubiquinone/menaquinone biosynthesis C-methylase UbiE
MASSKSAIDTRATAVTRARYDRVAFIYDWMDGLMERFFFHKWRERVWQAVGSEAKKIIEIGVGTGKNISYYPAGVQITAIDLSEQMLRRAKRRAADLDKTAELLLMDAQNMQFPDGSFETAVATFVFCSVPNPVLGLSEIERVLRPNGKVVLLEHMRPESPWLGKIFDLLNPVVVRLWGANINRRTVENIRKTGLRVERVQDLAAYGMVKLIIARKAE